MIEGLFERIADRIAGAASTTSRGKAVVLGSFALLVSSLFMPDQASIQAASVSSGLILVYLMYRHAFSIQSRVAERLVIERRVEGHAVEGRDLWVELVIRNPTAIPVFHLEVYDRPPRVFGAEGPQRPITLPGKSVVRLRYKVTPRVGVHSWGPLRLVVRDPLGLFQGSTEIPIETRVRVQPRPLDVPVASHRIPVVARFGGSASARRRGIGSEFLELREYRPEDDIRMIDWKASARSGKLVVKTFEHESSARVVVVLDFTPSMFQGAVGETKAEYSARLATSLAEYLSRRGDYYALIVVGARGDVSRTPWLRGRASVSEARRVIAEGASWPSLEEMGASPSRGEMDERARLVYERLVGMLAREKTLIVIISDFNESAEYAGMVGDRVKSLFRAHHVAVALVPITVAFEAARLGGLAGIYRVLALKDIARYAEIRGALRSRGIPSVVAGPRDLLEVILVRLEGLRGVAR